jgi:hypothetical protein
MTNTKKKPVNPSATKVPTHRDLWHQVIELGSQLNLKYSDLSARTEHNRTELGRLHSEVNAITSRFKPVIFIPKELDQLKVEATKIWHAPARPDRPYIPSDSNPYTLRLEAFR